MSGGLNDSTPRIEGGTDGTEIGNVSDSLKTSITNTSGASAVNIQDGGNSITVDVVNVSPATQNITMLDISTSSVVGANGQTFYLGTPTAGSSASFTLIGITTVDVLTTIIGTGGILVVEVSADSGTLWIRPNLFQPGTQNYGNSFTAGFLATLNTAGFTTIRVRAITSWSGTATIRIIETQNPKVVTIGESLPAGANIIGAVTQSGSWSISLPTGASTAALQTQPGVDIGDVTINNAAGASAVNIQDGGNSITVDGTGTFATQDTSSLVDNSGFTDGTSRILPVGFIFDESAGAALTENDVGAARVDVKRAQILVIEDGTTRGQRAVVTAANALKVDGSAVTQPVSGSLNSVPTDSTKTTYASGIVGLVTGALATDIFTLTGSATKTVRVIEIGISGSATAAAVVAVSLIKRSSANTLGTSTSPAIVPHDSTNAAGTAVARAYTVNATLGVTVGTLKTIRQLWDSTTIVSTYVLFKQDSNPGQAIVLRGVAEVLAVNISGVTLTGGAAAIYMVWTEE